MLLDNILNMIGIDKLNAIGTLPQYTDEIKVHITCLCLIPYLPVEQQFLQQLNILDYSMRLDIKLELSMLIDVDNLFTTATFKKGLQKISINVKCNNNRITK